MTLILVVDENDWQRQALCDFLRCQGYRTWQARDLAEVREALSMSAHRRGADSLKPALCLVELVREQGNGFSLAVWLQSRGLGRSVLLSDRGELADSLWARSRGIEWTLSRRLSAADFTAHLARILHATAGDNACA
ncbi:hypothetical protein PHACT_07170 [Pseudohongiella acticola]|uniref:Response regulatory domain-containing protein n=1 Tax=Pseudohongiella acticola TaxID=1524254 RepID=A0A1E8CKE8_9GAMM|nr:response regulator [Pseudohongiella acticola]OFE12946.1 hypothetical protein PHACT_07170 [Pseudohongiella acticola]